MKILYVVFDTSALKTCCKKDLELEEERQQLKQLRAFLLKSNVKINWYYSTDILGEYEQIPALVKKCNCELDAFGQAFLLALRRMKFIKTAFSFSHNISLEFSSKSSSQKIQKCIDDNLQIDEYDKKFIKLCASLALKGSSVCYIMMDREIRDMRPEIVKKLKSECGVKGKVYIVMPSEFLTELKKEFE